MTRLSLPRTRMKTVLERDVGRTVRTVAFQIPKFVRIGTVSAFKTPLRKTTCKPLLKVNWLCP